MNLSAQLSTIASVVKHFCATIWQELPKVLLQAIFALLIAGAGAYLGFWGQVRGENYRQRVEAVASLAGTAAELSQRVTSYCVAIINATFATAAANREERQSWYLRSDEILREIAHSKGEFHKSLSRVRILFHRPQIQPLLEKVDAASTACPGEEVAKASSLEELDAMRAKNIAGAARHVDETIGKTIAELVRGLEGELAKQGYGTN